MKWPGSEKDLPLIPRSNNPDKEKRMRLQKKGRTVFPRKRILTIRRTVLLTVTRMPGVAPDLLQVQQGIEGVTLDPLMTTMKETIEDKESHLSHGQITTRMPGVAPDLLQVQQDIEGVTLDPLIETVKETTEDKESHLSHG